MDIEDLLDAVFDVERLTGRLVATANGLEAIADEAAQAASRLAGELDETQIRLAALDGAVREPLLDRLHAKLDGACRLLGELLDAGDPEMSASAMDAVLGEIRRRFDVAIIAAPDGLEEEFQARVHAYEKKILARVGLSPASVADLVDAIVRSCRSGEAAGFGDEDRHGAVAATAELRGRLCAFCREERELLALFTLPDLRNLVGALRDLCVLTIDATAVVTTPDVTLVTLVTSAKSIVMAGASLRGRVDELGARAQQLMSAPPRR